MSCKFSNEMMLAGAIRDAGIKYVVYSGDVAESHLCSALQSFSEITLLRAIDERNAAYFAMGVAIETRQAVAVIAPDENAASSFLPAVTEAFYQNIPMLLIEERSSIGADVCPSAADAYESVATVVLSLADAADYAEARKNMVEICQALSYLGNNVSESAPVFISYVRSEGKEKAELPQKMEFIRSVNTFAKKAVWQQAASELKNSRGVVMIAENFADMTPSVAADFAERLGCQVVTDLELLPRVDTISMSSLLYGNADLSGIDHIITFSKTSSNRVEKLFGSGLPEGVMHWHVSPDGYFYDPFGRLDKVFCVNPDFFMSTLINEVGTSAGAEKNRIKITSEAKSGSDEICRLLNGIAPHIVGSSLQYSVCGGRKSLDMSRLAERIEVSTMSSDIVNTGCVSVFLGLAYNNPKKCILVIDDISFFKDINALATRHINSNIGIILVDYGKASHMSYSGPISSTHAVGSIAAWAKDTGFEFVDAANVDDAISKASVLSAEKQNLPVLMRVSAAKN